MMLTHLDPYLHHFDPKEPLLQRWALDLMDIVSEVLDPEAGDALEARLATPEFLTTLLENPHSTLIPRALATVSSKRFLPVVADLDTLWQTDHHPDDFPRGLARVLAEADPARAVSLFTDTIQACTVLDGDAPRHKLPAIAAALRKLPAGAAHELAHAMLAAFDAFARATDVDTPAPDFIVELAWRYDHPKAMAYLENYLSGVAAEDGRQARWALVRLAFELGDAADEYHLGCDRIEKLASIDLVDLAPLYREGTDLAAFETVMRQVGSRCYQGVTGLVARHAPLLADLRLAALLSELVDDPSYAKHLHKKKQRPYLYALIIALLLRAHRRETPVFEALSVEAALDILAADAPAAAHAEALVAWLAGRDPDAVIDPLRARLVPTEDYRPASGLIELAGRLKDDTLVEALMALSVELLDEDSDLAVTSALSLAGETYFDLADRRWETLTGAQQLRVLQVAECTPGHRARQCVEDHFDRFWQLDRETLLPLCTLLGIDCRQKLEPFVNKLQSEVDRTWLTLSLLHGDRSETVMALRNTYRAARAERLSRFDDIMETEAAENFLGRMPDHIDAELTCGSCRETFTYRLDRIWINPEAQGDYYPAQEFQCLGCHELAEFTFSEEGYFAVSLHAASFNFAESREAFQALLEQGPFDILPRVASNRRGRRITEALDTCREEIFSQPDDPFAFFELGNIYVNLNHRIKAQQCFEKVVELAPDAIEAHLMLAQMAIDEEDYGDARRQLERGEPFLASARLLKTDEVSRDALVAFYNTLAERVSDPAPDLSDLYAAVEPPVLREEKIGRNDPCPCGSGRKYKKCCLGRPA